MVTMLTVVMALTKWAAVWQPSTWVVAGPPRQLVLVLAIPVPCSTIIASSAGGTMIMGSLGKKIQTIAATIQVKWAVVC